MNGLDRRFDVLRIVIAAANHDHVLEAARDEELVLLKEAKIAGSQERPLAGIAAAGAKRAFGLLGLVPVALGHRWPRDPDLADRARRNRHVRLRIHDEHL